MSTAERPSTRLIEQRLRNRAMEALDWLAEGNGSIGVAGAHEYFEQFFDVIDDTGPHDWRSWSCLTPGEVAGLDAVLHIVIAACENTPARVSDDDFVASGWPSRIAPVATATLSLMKHRGSFQEDIEEDEPSLRC